MILQTKSEKKTRTQHSHKATVRERWRMVAAYQQCGSYYKAAEKLGHGTKRSQVRYWVQKLLNPSFHNNPNGGDKRGVFKVFERPIVHQEILYYLRLNPNAKELQIRCHVNFIFKRFIRKRAFSNLMKKMGWSSKVPTKFQIYKYTYKNLIYYTEYIKGVLEIPFLKLKYIYKHTLFPEN
jgi:hypothetical protein